MRPVVWADEARRDLISIVRYVAEENPVAAERVGARILDIAKQLGEFSTGRQGRVVGTHERSLSDLPYTISYTIDKTGTNSETIVILRIIHEARHWPPETWPR